MAKMLSLEMCHAWNMLALLVPRAGPVCVCVCVHTHAHTQNDAKVTSHCLLLFPLGCVGLTCTLISQSVSSFPMGFLLCVFVC
jgi:hypothetical protein